MQAENVKFSQFHLSLINGVIHECYKNGYMLLVNPLPSSGDEMTDSPVDGVIILDPTENDVRLTDSALQDKPHVVIGKPPISLINQLTYVDNDNVALMKKATKYLIDLQHQHFLFLNAPLNRTVAKERQQGFEEAIKEANLSLDQQTTIYKPENETSIEFAYQTTMKLLKEKPEITAIIADTDKMALGVYKAAQNLQIRIPEDLSVLAFSDDSIFTSKFIPDLTSVKLNAENLGCTAAQLLIQQIESKKRMVDHVIISAELIIQSSTDTAKTRSFNSNLEV
jgi:DNA-binding LacI/PurR family transcriptional regulator